MKSEKTSRRCFEQTAPEAFSVRVLFQNVAYILFSFRFGFLDTGSFFFSLHPLLLPPILLYPCLVHIMDILWYDNFLLSLHTYFGWDDNFLFLCHPRRVLLLAHCRFLSHLFFTSFSFSDQDRSSFSLSLCLLFFFFFFFFSLSFCLIYSVVRTAYGGCHMPHVAAVLRAICLSVFFHPPFFCFSLFSLLFFSFGCRLHDEPNDDYCVGCVGVWALSEEI